MSLSKRLRPDVEAAPWVIEEVTVLEAEIERLREALSNLLAVTRQFLTDEPQKEAEKQAEVALAGKQEVKNA